MFSGGEYGDTRVDGLTGSEANFKDLSNHSAGTVTVNDKALDHCPYDPNHSFAATTERIFGCKYGKSNSTPCTQIASTNGSATMDGFVQSARWEGKDGVNEMTMWPPEKVV